ncbi:hypothetical protein BDP27DRAFT_1549490, partial [Rhodocollybia butyracea]
MHLIRSIVRALSIIAMLLVFSSNIEVMVTCSKAVNFYEAHEGKNNATMGAMNMDYCVSFTEVLNPLVLTDVCGAVEVPFLISQLGYSCLNAPFTHFFPVLGSGFSTSALGIFQCLIGAHILSHHVDEFTLVSAFFLLSLGCLTLASFTGNPRRPGVHYFVACGIESRASYYKPSSSCIRQSFFSVSG